AGHLLHVDARARVEHRAPRGERDHRQRARHPVGGERRALERVDRDVYLRGRAVADLLAVVEHWSLVLLALPDHDDAVHLDRLEHAAHAVHGGLVGGLLVAFSDQRGARERGRLGDPDELQGEVAVGYRRLRRVVHSVENLYQGRSHYDRRVSDRDLTVQARLPSAVGPAVETALGRARAERVAERLRDEDATLWGPAGTPEIANRLGWLRIAERMLDELLEIERVADGARRDGLGD